MLKRVSLYISGLVQGVGFRYLAQKEAQRRGFTGYVRNLDMDRVEVVAEGEEQELKEFIQWCYNGVGTAQVYKIEENWSDSTGEFSGFMIR